MKRFLFNVFLANVPFLAVVGAIVLTWEISHSAGHDWRAGYLNQYGDACCDDIDCREIRTDVALRLRLGELAKVGELAYTQINTIYPTQDGRSWVCTTGCLFRPSLRGKPAS